MMHIHMISYAYYIIFPSVCAFPTKNPHPSRRPRRKKQKSQANQLLAQPWGWSTTSRAPHSIRDRGLSMATVFVVGQQLWALLGG